MMASNRTQIFNKPCWSKPRGNKTLFCYVCYNYRAAQLFSTKYCSSFVLHRVCEECVHQHIVSTLNSCLVNSVTCPEYNCSAIISSSAISDILLQYNDNDLLNDYLREKDCQGKSEEWIQRFTVRCPDCNVPIQKKNGCNHMVCSRCKKHFKWIKPRIPRENNGPTVVNIYLVVGCILVIIILIVLLFSYIFNKK